MGAVICTFNESDSSSSVHQLSLRLFAQQPAQLALHSFQQRGVGLGIEAAHPPPVASKPHLHRLRAARLAQDYADVHVFVAHRVRHVAQQLKLAVPPMDCAAHSSKWSGLSGQGSVVSAQSSGLSGQGSDVARQLTKARELSPQH